uniref:Wsv165 n=1 Tax=White spot syndrome virus TaxID=92652 RepID=A0A2U9GFD2_WSSV|nr:wsv165 [Shrimp white spot syndrome virus]
MFRWNLDSASSSFFRCWFLIICFFKAVLGLCLGGIFVRWDKHYKKTKIFKTLFYFVGAAVLVCTSNSKPSSITYISISSSSPPLCLDK